MVKRSILFLVPFALLAFTATTASANEPWWQVTSGSAPTDLVPGSGSDEVQELTVNAEGGELALRRALEYDPATEEGWNLTSAGIAWGASPATAQRVQEALEELYGAGNVLVSSPRPGRMW